MLMPLYSVWHADKLVRATKTPTRPLKVVNSLIYTAEEKAEVFASVVEDQFQHNMIFNMKEWN